MTYNFAGKVAIITGAASGIGLATARYFAECGASVLMADINVQALQTAAHDTDPSAKKVAWTYYDAADQLSAAACVNLAISKFGRLDYLVTAAGIYQQQKISDMDDAQWHRVIAVNLDGLYYLVRNAITRFEPGGSIVAIASVAAHQGGTSGNVHYGASKGGVLALARGLARETAPTLRVNAISPGWIETPMVMEAVAKNGQDIMKGIPLQRIGAPREIATIAAFLCSDAASFVTGETIIAAGGAYMA